MSAPFEFATIAEPETHAKLTVALDTPSDVVILVEAFLAILDLTCVVSIRLTLSPPLLLSMSRTHNDVTQLAKASSLVLRFQAFVFGAEAIERIASFMLAARHI